MKIQKTALGWNIEPSTNDEQKELEFLMDNLREKYSKGYPSETKDFELTTHLQSLDQTHRNPEPA
jgi:hypothetical protein